MAHGAIHMSWLIYLAALLPLLCLALLLQQYQQQDRQQHPSPQRREPAAPGEKAFSHWLGALPLYRDSGNVWREARSRSRRIAGLALILRRAGVANPRDQLAVYTSAALVAALAALAAGGGALYAGHPPAKAAMMTLAVLIGLVLAILAIARRRAERRQLAIEQEASMLIQVTRMLWRVGLSLPRTIAVLCEELAELAPETTRELRSALHKIDTGQSQEEALAELAEITTSEGFREYLVITRQVSQSGGGVDQALADLYHLLQNRRRAELQEKVSKLSAKMSVVMMLLLFPTLLIVVGGPGFIAIAGAMTQLTGG